MVIGAHIWGKDVEESLLLFALKKTASLQPAIKVIFFTNSPLDNLPQNCVQVYIYPRPTNNILLYYWYNYKLPKLLLKYNINLFFSNVGMLASGISIKQFLFIEHKDLFEERNSFCKKRLSTGVEIAQTVFVIDNVIGENISNQFPATKDKIQLLNFSLNESSSLFTLKDIKGVREKYTTGFDFYLFRVDEISKAHILTLLKSFSKLKKWQKTAVKMIMLFENDIDEKLLPDFKNYKYRDEVVLLKETDKNLSLLTAAAFAYIYFGNYKSRDNVYRALQYNIPVIAADTIINNLLFKTAVCYTVASVDGLALQLQLIYKDEVYRKQLLQKSTIYLTNFDSISASQKFAEVVSN